MTDLVLAPKKALAIIVMIAFIMVCVLAPFGAAHAIVGVSTAAVTILIAALAAAGITFTTTGAFDSIEEYVEGLLQEYAQDNNIPVTGVFTGSSWQASAAGKLLLNNRFVRLVSSFATWLKTKLSLSDNSNITIIAPGTTIDGLTAYQLPISWYYKINDTNGYNFEYTVISSSDVVYGVFSYTSNMTSDQATLKLFSTAPATINLYTQNQHVNTNTTISLSRVNAYTAFPYFKDANKTQGLLQPFETCTWSDLYQVLTGTDTNVETNNIGIGINTGTIDIPTDRTDYTNTSGAILDVNAPWSIPVSGVIDTIPDAWSSVEDDTTIYSLDLEAEAVIEQQLPQPSDIENLPGATIPGLPDIEEGEPWHLEFSNLWHYVAQWISDMSAGGSVIWNTCIQAPPAIINFVFAGIVLAMWFGAIKILR